MADINYTTCELCDKFTEEIADEENVDVYQLCAVICAVDQHIKQASDTRKCEKICYYSKAIICFCFQTIILAMMVVQYSINSYNKQQDEEMKYNTDEMKITSAFFASLYISFSIVTWWLDIELNGLYVIEHREYFINCPNYVNKWWIYIGLHANGLTLLFGLIGSNILLFWASDAFDVILNCVAVFFMVQIDNEIVGTSDYENLRNWISDFRQEFDLQQKGLDLQINAQGTGLNIKEENANDNTTENDGILENKSVDKENINDKKQDECVDNQEQKEKQVTVAGSSIVETNDDNKSQQITVESKRENAEINENEQLLMKLQQGSVKMKKDALYLTCNNACNDFKGEGNNSKANGCCDCICNVFGLILVGTMWFCAFVAPVIITILPFILNKCCLD
eukprot:204024_1